MIPLHPVPYIGAPLLVLGLQFSALAASVGMPIPSLIAGLVGLLATCLMGAS